MLQLKFGKVVGNVGHGIDYGMSVAGNTSKELVEIIEDFAQDHTFTQEKNQNLSQSLPQIHSNMQQQ